MTPTATWGDREARRRDIMDAGRRLLSQQGYAALQMRDVAAGAGVSAGTVYTYFAAKEDLYAALFVEAVDEFCDQLEAILAAPGTPEQVFVQVATAYRDNYAVYGRDLNIWSVAFQADEIAEKNKPLLDASLRATGLAVQIVRATRPAGLPPEVDDVAVMSVFWAAITGLADQFTGVRGRLHDRSWQQSAELAAAILVGGLRALAEGH
ncbi:MAG: TetR/AcrR family transcriptional regulator [Gordonia sp. (in: high G+C Gram-positive bacteria)]|uniref:TetR/AcrR family transcriptional regulator n=1 Tax=Gordonia sp. (in: high G+C Gram-positive bacteria) TaxID=84139 RepID=UPI0039E3BEEA